MKNINRREALRKTAYVMGGTLMAPTIAGILNGCTPAPKLNWTPSFFTEDQAKLVTSVADIIMPKTDTPAASELGVPGFIEQMVSSVAAPEDREKFMANLASFEQACQAKMGSVYNELSAEKQTEFVNLQHASLAEGEFDWQNKPFILSIKEMTIAGYCVTEIGATQMLQHVFIPGEYKGCVPVEEAGNGKTWSM
jgi:gluconate 2-dehydrogenase gamma chain